MIFHYFGSKLGMYELLILESVEFIKRFMLEVPREIEKYDYIEQYSYTTKKKLEAYIINPQIFEFQTHLYLHNEEIGVSTEVKKAYTDILKTRFELLKQIQESNNTNSFREDLDPQTIKDIISWTIEGYSQKIIREFSTTDIQKAFTKDYWSEFDTLLEDLKKIFYKQEGRD